MDLILWRHAEAEETPEADDDLNRALTGRGEKQAARVGAWLDRLRPELGPDCTTALLLETAQWPVAKQSVVIIGHQPVLGQAVAQLLGLNSDSCPVRKGAVWWIRTRERDGHQQTVVVAVQSPDAL